MRTISTRNSPIGAVLLAFVVVLSSQTLVVAQPLTAQDKEILKWCVSGISIQYERDKPENGFSVLIELTTEFETRGGTQRMWNGSGVARVNGKRAFSSSLGLALHYATEDEAYAKIQKNLKQVLTDSTKDKIEFSFSLIKDN